jgi:hypothetical protein
MRIRVESESPPGRIARGQELRIINADTGEPIETAKSIVIRCTGNHEPVTATIEFVDVELNVEAVDVEADLAPETAG